jgi:hypothetical protein
MVSTYYSLLLAAIGLPSALAGPRYATFYDSKSSRSTLTCQLLMIPGKDCDAKETTSETIPFKMEDHSCIYETTRQSFIPGEKDAGGGDYCFVYYDDDYCGCIAGSRLIHTVGSAWDVECETKGVEGYKSYHFQPAKDVSYPLIR